MNVSSYTYVVYASSYKYSKITCILYAIVDSKNLREKNKI